MMFSAGSSYRIPFSRWRGTDDAFHAAASCSQRAISVLNCMWKPFSGADVQRDCAGWREHNIGDLSPGGDKKGTQVVRSRTWFDGVAGLASMFHVPADNAHCLLAFFILSGIV